MEKLFSNKAQIPNPSLRQFNKLVGEWKTTGKHPAVPGKTLEGKSFFNWIEGGAFLTWHSSLDDDRFPDGIAIFGSDDATGELFMIYFDERKVSRKYDVSFENNVLKWWRNNPEFSQRYSWTFADDDNTIIGKGELNEDGKAWEKDLDMTFTRIK